MLVQMEILTPGRVWGAREPRCLVPDVREFIFEKETDENSQRSASPQLPAGAVRARVRGCGASFSAPPAGRKARLAAVSGDAAELKAVKETVNEADGRR